MTAAPDWSSLPRVLEPEAMDSPDEAREYDTMDHAQVNRAFVQDLLTARNRAGLPLDAEVLDLGTGTAQIPIELCAQNPQARVVAVDMAGEMLAVAAANLARQGTRSRVTLERADAKHLPHASGRFSIVMSNSIVHHIPDPRAVLAEAVRVLARPGLIYVRDLARPRDLAQLEWLVDTYAAGVSEQQRQLFDASLHAALSVGEVRELVSQLGFPPDGVSATSDRHWTWAAAVRQ
ncbi:MAG TPA: class I SAM-dependent methyltransferase [Pirellulales bacterium]|jgi:ubiquinone/menaquinone biosynthesis C-methylase UbiE